jgi:hypothetical protein
MTIQHNSILANGRNRSDVASELGRMAVTFKIRDTEPVCRRSVPLGREVRLRHLIAYFDGMHVPLVICELIKPKVSLVAPNFLA